MFPEGFISKIIRAAIANGVGTILGAIVGGIVFGVIAAIIGAVLGSAFQTQSYRSSSDSVSVLLGSILGVSSFCGTLALAARRGGLQGCFWSY